ncbi:Condensin-2 complex subunit H2 [Amphibalanus amphitrite]|uniref:Condensin-2 complex subunit H2 n=1 Tax=Amphibalanus amphitrite TaxID=1232801 RepID=A0A6A4W294_AMPAM|nr:condensin-2 complex subunit H2-like [Amphibalanus amphitrite]XP_043209645.1 condensin-2 complex subunit H2-like [Amphibalanus amphitrite]KAF0297809.1 Condensin-2 complex subunit H2 [Amphibalanus amphitrite]KAF0297810.1 Condensin-2 complex subunit H2 [Amphibalanus amphitrite]
MAPPPDETRFGFLLNPIKDLTKNWQVDLNKFLGEYLDELASMPITFDGGETVMNFAEAAMLIQGSACVYSRKVEFLWKMVLQMVDLLANKKVAAQQGSKGKKGGDPNETIGFLPVDDMPMCKKQMKEESEDKVSLKFLPVTPVCLVDKDKTKKAVPLFSLAGDLLGNKDDYRLNSTMSTATGLLCTEMDVESLLRHHVKTSFSPTKSPDVSAALSTTAAAAADDPDDACEPPPPPSPPPPASPEPPPPPSPPPSPPRASPERRTGLRQSARRRREATPCLAPGSEPEQRWRPVNPYGETGRKRPPIRRGRITLRPPCLCQKETVSKRKRKLAETAAAAAASVTTASADSVYGSGEKPPPPPVVDYLKTELLTHSGRLTRSQLRHVISKMPAEVLAEMQNRKQALADIKQQKREEDELAAAAEAAAAADDAASDGGAGDMADFPDMPDPADHPADLPSAAAPPSAPPDSYEELVQRRVAEYLSAAQEYVQSTELSRRVARWQETVLPRLEREEKRSEFNIHDYGSRILERFPEGSAKTTVAFADIVKGEEAPEVARYLLSSLMLANTYNVEIFEPGPPDQAMDTMELTLLSRKRHHEALDGYSAPSQGSPRRKSQESRSSSGSGGGGSSTAGRTRSSPPRKASAAAGRKKRPAAAARQRSRQDL